jgi:DNA-binding LytR/AlgR family response regulator
MADVQSRARFEWRDNSSCARRLPATRRLTMRPARTPVRTLPCRTACPQQTVTGESSPAYQLPTLPKLDGLLEGFCPEPQPEEQIPFKSEGRLLIVRLADIDWLEVSEGRVALHVGKETHLLDDSLSTAAAKLPSDRFLRISPSALVNVAQVKDTRVLCRGEWRVVLRNGRRLNLGGGSGEGAGQHRICRHRTQPPENIR